MKEIIRQVRRIEIRTRKIVEENLAGQYHSAFKGQGMEFSEVRAYQPGDDVRTIDWNVTARAGEPFIKKFVEERELTVMVVVDMSGSQEFGSGNMNTCRLAGFMTQLSFTATFYNAVLCIYAVSSHDQRSSSCSTQKEAVGQCDKQYYYQQQQGFPMGR